MVNKLEWDKNKYEGKFRTIEELDILDDFFFSELMMNKQYGQEFIEYFLKTVLDTDVMIKEVRAQAIHSGGDPNNKGIRMDVLIEGEIGLNKGVTIDVEMQKDSKKVQKGQ